MMYLRINYVVEELINKGNQINVVTGLPNYPKGEIPSEYNFKKLTVLNEYRSKVFRVPIIPRKIYTFKHYFKLFIFLFLDISKTVKKLKMRLKEMLF